MKDLYMRMVERLTPGLEYHQNRYAALLDTCVTAGIRWLDLGAGRRIHGGWGGTDQLELASRPALFAGCDLVGPHLRLNPYLHDRVMSSGAKLPFKSDSFELVSANMVLEHLETPESVFAEIARVLVPGGRFVFLTPNIGHPVVRLASIFLAPWMRKALAHITEGRALSHIFLTHYRANSVEALARVASEVGLQHQSQEVFFSYPMRAAAPLTFIELLWIRMARNTRARGMGSNIIGMPAETSCAGRSNSSNRTAQPHAARVVPQLLHQASRNHSGSPSPLSMASCLIIASRKYLVAQFRTS